MVSEILEELANFDISIAMNTCEQAISAGF